MCRSNTMFKPRIEPGSLEIALQVLYHLEYEDDTQLSISHSDMLVKLQLQRKME